MANYVNKHLKFKEKLSALFKVFVILCNSGSLKKSQIFFSQLNFSLTDSMNVSFVPLFSHEN